jgi:hypothetical protein
VLGGDAHAQRRGPDPKLQRRIEDQRLTVHAGGDGTVRVDLELGR